MRNKYPIIINLLFLILILTNCSSDIPMVSVGIDDHYYIARMQKLRLRPALDDGNCSWVITSPDGTETVYSDRKELVFIGSQEGVYSLKLTISGDVSPVVYTSEIKVSHEEVEYSPWISKVYDYHPAPGQFVNTMPEYEEGDDYAKILQKVSGAICGEEGNLITLGAFGGYVTFGFDHTVVNIPGQNDFRIWGNAVYQKSADGRLGGSAEPGIIMVSLDTNGNGIPDDTWYELQGSEHTNHYTLFNYSVTYHRPSDTHTPVPSGSSITDLEYIPWSGSDGQSGFLSKNTFHTQAYYPAWISEESLTFTGTRLPENAHDTFGNGSNFFLESFAWGYADNHPNTEEDLNSFNISNAVDSFGNKVSLPGIDFIRVYTAMHQQCNWLGETSTEISRACDLHIIN